MLILIAGITGNIGQHAARAGLSRNHQIRGLGRTPDKLDTSVYKKLESFVVSRNYYDINALETAVNGVDAVICAYAGLPELALEGQLLLLRAAERAGIKRFLAASWNYDWRTLNLGDQEVYDAYIAFHSHVTLSSSIKTLHILTGILTEVFFGCDGQEGFTPKDDGVWDPSPPLPPGTSKGKRIRGMDVYGTGNEPWYLTSEADAGAFGIELVASPNAENGGFYKLVSGMHSLREIKGIYESVHADAEVIITEKGSVEELEKKAVEKKREYGRERWWEYHRLFFQLFTINGRWSLGDDVDNAKFPGVKVKSLESFFRERLEV